MDNATANLLRPGLSPDARRYALQSAHRVNTFITRRAYCVTAPLQTPRKSHKAESKDTHKGMAQGRNQGYTQGERWRRTSSPFQTWLIGRHKKRYAHPKAVQLCSSSCEGSLWKTSSQGSSTLIFVQAQTLTSVITGACAAHFAQYGLKLCVIRAKQTPK